MLTFILISAAKAVFSPETIFVGIHLINSYLNGTGRVLIDGISLQHYQLNVILHNGIEVKVGGYGKMVSNIESKVFDTAHNHLLDPSKTTYMRSFLKGLLFLSHFCDFYHENIFE